MILSELTKLIAEHVKDCTLVRKILVTDAAELNTMELDYGVVVITPMSSVRHDHTMSYRYIIYYVDMIHQNDVSPDDDGTDFDNTVEIQTDGIGVLDNMVMKMEDDGVVHGDYQYTFFRHKFLDWCAGVYVDMSFEVPFDNCNTRPFDI